MSLCFRSLKSNPYFSIEELDKNVKQMLVEPHDSEKIKLIFSKIAEILNLNRSELEKYISIDPKRCKLFRQLGGRLRQLDCNLFMSEIFFGKTIKEAIADIQHRARLKHFSSSDSKENNLFRRKVIPKIEPSKEKIKFISELISHQTQIYHSSGEYHEDNAYLKRNGEVLGQAFEITQAMNSQDIPVLYTAQTTISILFQVAAKKVYESKYKDIGKNRKILRVKPNIETIKEAKFYDEFRKATLSQREAAKGYKDLICASTNISDCEMGESFNYFLYNSHESGADCFGLYHSVMHMLNCYCVDIEFKNKKSFADQICKISDKYKSKLPFRMLEVIVPDMQDISNYVRLCITNGMQCLEKKLSHLDDEDLHKYLLKANKTKPVHQIQARILASSAESKGVRAVRCIAKEHKPIFNRAKKEISMAVDQLLNPKPSSLCCPRFFRKKLS